MLTAIISQFQQSSQEGGVMDLHEMPPLLTPVWALAERRYQHLSWREGGEEVEQAYTRT